MNKIIPIVFLCVIFNVHSQDSIPLFHFDSISNHLQKLAQEEKFEAIVNSIDNFHKNDSAYNSLLVTKGYYQLRLKQYGEAENTMRFGLENEKGDLRSSFYQNLGVSLERQEKWQEALTYYDKALVEYPRNHIFLYKKAYCLEQLGQIENAATKYKEGIRMYPFYRAPYAALANLYYQQRQTAQALLLYNIFLVMEPDADNAFHYLKLANERANYPLETIVVDPIAISIDDDGFKEINKILNARISMNSNYPLPNDLNIALVRQTDALLKLLGEFKGSGGFWEKDIIPYYKWVSSSEKFNDLSYTVCYSIKNEKYKKLVDKQVETIQGFMGDSENKLSENIQIGKSPWEDQPGNVYHHYGDGYLSAIGRYENETPKGYYEYYTSKGRLSSKGYFNEKGEKTGKWTWYGPGGYLKETANYEKGELSGENLGYFKNGRLEYRAQYKNDALDGDYELYRQNGALYHKKRFKNGKLDGDFLSHKEVGEGHPHQKINYTKGLIQGQVITYNDLKNTIATYEFKEGKRNGTDKAYYDNGILQSQNQFVNGLMQGMQSSYFPNEQLESEVNAMDDLYEGVRKTYFPDGVLETTSEYSEGSRNGLFTEYDNDGKPYYQFEYKKDNLIAYTYFDKAGEVRKAAKKKGGEFPYTGYTAYGQKKGEGLYDIKGGKEGLWSFYSDHGVLNDSGTYSDNRLIGTAKTYYNTGEPLSISQYGTDGVIHGYYQEMHTNGKLKTQGWYISGQRHGQWEHYYPDGTLKERLYYHKDELHGSQDFFAPDGKKASSSVYEYDTLLHDQYYDPQGHVMQKLDYKKDAQLVLSSAYKNGQMETSQQYRYGIKHGSYKRWGYFGQVLVEGQYVNGKAQGVWKSYYDTGELSREFAFILDKLTYDKSFYKNGQLESEEYYLNGQKHGTWKNFSEQGHLELQIEYLLDHKVGPQYFYGPEGELQLIRHYQMGRLMGYSYHDANGRPTAMTPLANESGRIEATYKNGKPSRQMNYDKGEFNGDYDSFYHSGQLLRRTPYSKGRVHGESVEYYSDGTLKKRLPYQYDFLHGTVEEFYANGKLKRTTEYLWNKLHGNQIWYNEKGDPIKKTTYFNDSILLSEKP
ncbi:tetratricopeptide repeat protein [Sediminicola luteus]|uniref:Uncharacterized protein n=1 Tax=Sediminicola luteus TaxID=319238 RepID=A0A2A4GDF9_9FLAO|nr:tetratricopeptide repeat protein [Sediminicola luteus]PCE66016.1 hypothetical protein B7P33_01560 [Sediminicola luteus]